MYGKFSKLKFGIVFKLFRCIINKTTQKNFTSFKSGYYFETSTVQLQQEKPLNSKIVLKMYCRYKYKNKVPASIYY